MVCEHFRWSLALILIAAFVSLGYGSMIQELRTTRLVLNLAAVLLVVVKLWQLLRHFTKYISTCWCDGELELGVWILLTFVVRQLSRLVNLLLKQIH